MLLIGLAASNSATPWRSSMVGDRTESLAAICPSEADIDFSLQTLTKRLVKAGKLRVIPVSDEKKHFSKSE